MDLNYDKLREERRNYDPAKDWCGENLRLLEMRLEIARKQLERAMSPGG